MAAPLSSHSIFDVFSKGCNFSSLPCHFPVAFSEALSDIAPVAAGWQRLTDQTYPRDVMMSGCSSGVEHNLAKVGVEGSNPFARSNFPRRHFYIQNVASGVASAAGIIVLMAALFHFQKLSTGLIFFIKNLLHFICVWGK
jgi:hypothetical protein